MANFLNFLVDLIDAVTVVFVVARHNEDLLELLALPLDEILVVLLKGVPDVTQQHEVRR